MAWIVASVPFWIAGLWLLVSSFYGITVAYAEVRAGLRQEAGNTMTLVSLFLAIAAVLLALAAKVAS